MFFCSIIIPAFNHAALTRQCLDALLADAELPERTEIIVVDDASTDETAEMLASYGEAVRVVSHDRNRGFAVSSNDGAAAAAGQYLVFLNNDTIPQAGWLKALAAYQAAHPFVAALGARLLYPDGKVQHAGVIIGQDRNPSHMYAGFPGDHPAVCKSRRFQIVTGACLWIRRAMFAELGGFDTSYNNGFEDVDLCLRIGELGREIHYCHEAVLIHFESQTRGRAPEDDYLNHAQYRARWADRIQPDDFGYYFDDGLLKPHYGLPHRLEVDAAFGQLSWSNAASQRIDTSRQIAREQAHRVVNLAAGVAPHAKKRKRIGICGTFDVKNYGDLLFPYLAEFELTKRLGDFEFERFSYHAKSADGWCYPVRSVSELPEAILSLDGLIIGGGHLMRFDKAIAPGYAPPHADIHHPTGYWLTPALLALQHGRTVVWNAPGVFGQPPFWALPLLELALAQSHYVAVRDESSRATLAPCAGGNVLQVVPDTAFGLPQLIQLDRPSSQWQAWRRQAGLQRPYIVLQACEATADLAAWLSDNAAAFAAYQFVILPIGPDLNDRVTNSHLRGLQVVTVNDWPLPLLLAEIIAHAEAVAGVSLHLAITATAFGLPVLRSAERRDEKYRVLSAFETVWEYAGTGALSVESVLAHWRTRMPRAVLAQLQDRLDTHWDAVATALSATEPDKLASQRVNAFWQSLPGILEAALPREVLTEKEQALAQIEKMKNSTSWRVTRPLREFMRFWRKQPSAD